MARSRVMCRSTKVAPKTVNQKRYVDSIREHTITFGIGPAGTGKTFLAVAMAAAALDARDVSRVILTRPAVEAGERLGFLPGDIQAKVDPYLRPLFDALYDMLDPDRVNSYFEKGVIEVAPLAFMRGRTLNDSFVILDEAQNTTSEQMKMFLTRLGFGSKAVVTGDITQIDLPNPRSSGLVEVLHGYPLDGVVLTTGCDKTTPAALMAAATVNIPAIALSVGPMLNGWHDGQRTGSGTIVWKAREMLAAGTIAPFRIKSILVPVDCSDCSKKALQYAVPLANQHQASVTLLYVITTPSYNTGEYGEINYALLETEMRATAEEKLNALSDKEFASSTNRQCVVRTGSASAEIIALAKSMPADLIVISTHGRSGIKHVLLGSVAEDVVRRAPCPVLVVREREHDFVAG